MDGVGTLRLLDAVKTCGLINSVRFYQASTSELYGKVQEIPQKETTPFYPRSPYGEKARPCPARGLATPRGWPGGGAEGRGLPARRLCAGGDSCHLCLWVESPSHRTLRTERCEREVASCKILGAGELWVVLK